MIQIYFFSKLSKFIMGVELSLTQSTKGVELSLTQSTK